MNIFDMGPNGAYVWAGWIVSILTLAACALLVWRERAKARKRKTRSANQD